VIAHRDDRVAAGCLCVGDRGGEAVDVGVAVADDEDAGGVGKSHWSRPQFSLRSARARLWRARPRLADPDPDVQHQPGSDRPGWGAQLLEEHGAAEDARESHEHDKTCARTQAHQLPVAAIAGRTTGVDSSPREFSGTGDLSLLSEVAAVRSWNRGPKVVLRAHPRRHQRSCQGPLRTRNLLSNTERRPTVLSTESHRHARFRRAIASGSVTFAAVARRAPCARTRRRPRTHCCFSHPASSIEGWAAAKWQARFVIETGPGRTRRRWPARCGADGSIRSAAEGGGTWPGNAVRAARRTRAGCGGQRLAGGDAIGFGWAVLAEPVPGRPTKLYPREIQICTLDRDEPVSCGCVVFLPHSHRRR
jgi:hypothetical protein